MAFAATLLCAILFAISLLRCFNLMCDSWEDDDKANTTPADIRKIYNILENCGVPVTEPKTGRNPDRHHSSIIAILSRAKIAWIHLV